MICTVDTAYTVYTIETALHYTPKILACMSIYIVREGLDPYQNRLGRDEQNVGVDGLDWSVYPLDCYDYSSTGRANETHMCF